MLGEPAVDTPDLVRGQVDLDLGSAVPTSSELSHEVVGQDRLVVVLRAKHPLARRIDVESFAAAEHVIASRRGRLRDGVDKLLAERGLRRRVVASVPTTALALHAVAHSDAVSMLPARACAQACADLGLITRELDLDLPPAPVVLAWHRRYDTDLAHVWLRQHCQGALTAMLASSTRTRRQRPGLG